MSLGLGLGLPFLRKIAGGGAGSLLEQVIQIVGSAEGAIIDPTAAFARNAIWEDSARTTLASVDGPVGSIQDELLRYYAAQATTANKPILRSDGLEFDGAADHVAIPDDPALRFGTSDFTLAFACRPDVVSGSRGIFSKRGTGGPGTNPGWGLRQAAADLILEYDHPLSAISPTYALANAAFTAANWTYGIAQVNRLAATATARVNGADRAPVAINVGDISGTRPVTIGNEPTLIFPFDGTTGRLLAINRLLTVQEIATVEAWLQEGLS